MCWASFGDYGVLRSPVRIAANEGIVVQWFTLKESTQLAERQGVSYFQLNPHWSSCVDSILALPVGVFCLKVCSICGIEKPVSEFYRNEKNAGGLTRKCKYCHSKQSYESRKKRNPYSRAKYDKQVRLRIKYGLTEEEYEDMIKSQNNLCKICGEAETQKILGKPKNLSIDHDHKSGKVRGLLCSTCNIGIGMFKDSPKLMHKAIEYLDSGKVTCCGG